jgi:hypothetical protein
MGSLPTYEPLGALVSSQGVADTERERAKRMTIGFDSLIDRLLETFPEFGPPYREQDWIDEDLAYLLYGYGGFVSFFTDAFIRDPNSDLTQRCIDFLEDLATRGDKLTRELVQVGVMEDLGKRESPAFDQAFVDAVRPRLHPVSRYLLDEITAFWDGRLQDFHRDNPRAPDRS